MCCSLPNGHWHVKKYGGSFYFDSKKQRVLCQKRSQMFSFVEFDGGSLLFLLLLLGHHKEASVQPGAKRLQTTASLQGKQTIRSGQKETNKENNLDVQFSLSNSERDGSSFHDNSSNAVELHARAKRTITRLGQKGGQRWFHLVFLDD
jgi:hypothetical protein